MVPFIPLHSFRRGTGKSNLAANAAVLLAAEGRRVGVVDIDIQSPSIHVLFGLNEDGLDYFLNDYLWARCDIIQAVHKPPPGPASSLNGQVFVVPASPEPGAITRTLREGFDAQRLVDGFYHLAEALDLDALLVDTHAGLNEETLVAMAMCDTLAVVLRPDQQDYQGTGITVDVARKLNVPHIALIVNEAPAAFDFAQVKREIEQTYGCEVVAVLPHADEMMALASVDIFALRYPEHPLTTTLEALAARLVP